MLRRPTSGASGHVVQLAASGELTFIAAIGADRRDRDRELGRTEHRNARTVRRKPWKQDPRRSAEKGTLAVELSDAELEKRRKDWKPRRHDYQSGTLWKYAQTVGDAEKGAVTHPGGKAETHVYADI